MKYLCLAAMALTLTACENGFRDALGLGKSVPDEFRVVKHAPLVVPPNYDLVPPQPGVARPQENDATARAKQALLGENTRTEATTTSGADALLRQAGVSETDPNIRAKIDSEEEGVSDENTPVAQRLFGIGNDEREGKIINPRAEAVRLKEKSAAASIPNAPNPEDLKNVPTLPREKPLNVPPTSNAPNSVE